MRHFADFSLHAPIITLMFSSAPFFAAAISRDADGHHILMFRLLFRAAATFRRQVSLRCRAA